MNDLSAPKAPPSQSSPRQKPVAIPVDAYLSEDYARAEKDRLWAKVWQVACREEEIPEVGDYITYEILDESIIVVRSAPDTISAYYNVCQHRGRRLAEGGCGKVRQFVCKFHGWRWSLDGKNQFILDPEDYDGCLTEENTRLSDVKVDTWGGWVWINMDPEAEPLLDYLEPAASMLAPFEIDKMRYRWRKWLHVPCNWKTAIEAFNESFHATTVHPEFRKYGENYFWCKAEGNCSWHGQSGARGEGTRSTEGGSAGSWSFAGADDADWRLLFAEIQNDVKTYIDATTTDTLVDAAQRLVDELPAGTSAPDVMTHMMTQAYQADAARGVVWPQVPMETIAATGHDWHIFPNTVFLHGLTSTLCYRARPNGYDPNSCIFEVYVIERYPDGQEPKTEWKHTPDPGEDSWPRLLSQDFLNMPEVQKGMKSRGFKGPRPSPVQELGVIHFHNLLARHMGLGEPEPL